MRHKLRLNLAEQEEREQIIKLRRVSLRDRLAKFLLGEKRKYTIVVPGDSIDQVTIIQKGSEELAEAIERHPSSKKAGK